MLNRKGNKETDRRKGIATDKVFEKETDAGDTGKGVIRQEHVVIKLRTEMA